MTKERQEYIALKVLKALSTMDEEKAAAFIRKNCQGRPDIEDFMMYALQVAKHGEPV